MTSYVVTIPGTLHEPLTDEARFALLGALRPVDPQSTDVGAAEELGLLSVDTEQSTFTLHLEVEADDSNTAKEDARRLASSAFEQAGFTMRGALLGEPVITGIDSE